MKKRHFLKASAALPIVLAASPAWACKEGDVLAIVSHPVSDFQTWSEVFKKARQHRDKHGITGTEVFQEPGDPNKVVVIHRFPTAEAAKKFFDSEGHADTLKKGGATAPAVIMLAADAA